MSENYFMDDACKFAADAARKVGRPLLIRGEPGVGKSSLAKAYADLDKEKMAYVSEVVTAHTEANDLLWRFDGIKRLGDAHCCCHPDKDIDLSAVRYVSPGVLWWAFNAKTAETHYATCPGNAYPTLNYDPETPLVRDWVVLIDEIDKADSSVPNSLLGALADKEIKVPHLKEPVALSNNAQPLIVFTTNEDRELPPAFLRRCFVLHMEFPKTEQDAISWLANRAEKNNEIRIQDRNLLETVAAFFFKKRHLTRGRHKPGLSEYLDLLQVLQEYPEKKNSLDDLSRFIMDKNSHLNRYSS